VAQRLRQRRFEDGALDLETIEPRAIVEDGRVVQLRHEKKNRARALIEDFMIAANGVTARYLEAKKFQPSGVSFDPRNDGTDSKLWRNNWASACQSSLIQRLCRNSC
jgi:exoribonuclease II